MKKLLSLPFIIIFMIASVFPTIAIASDTDPDSELELQQAISLALENSTSLKLYDEKIVIAERNYNKALSDSKNAVGKNWESSEERIALKKTEILVPLQKLNELDELKWQKQNEERNIKLNVMTKFFRLQQKENQIELQKKNIEQAISELEMQKVKVKNGLAAESTLLSMEISVDNAQTALSKLENERSAMIMELNAMIGYELDKNTQISKQEIPFEVFEIDDISELIMENCSNGYSIRQLETKRMLTEKERDIYRNYSFNVRPDEIDDLEVTLHKLEYDIRDAKISMERSIRVDYNNILNSLDTVRINKLSYEKAVMQKEISDKRFTLGMINKIDMDKVSLACDQALMTYNNSVIDYYLAVESFNFHYMANDR